MNNPQTAREITGIVTTELNRYGAMTLRSEANETFQIVDCASPDLAEELSMLGVGDRVTVTLAEAPCRGNGWQVIDVDADAATDTRLVA